MANDEMILATLRAIGEDDAADRLEKVLQASGSTAPAEPAEEPSAPTPQRAMTAADAHEAQRQAEGQALLETMQRQLGRQWVSVPLMDGQS